MIPQSPMPSDGRGGIVWEGRNPSEHGCGAQKRAFRECDHGDVPMSGVRRTKGGNGFRLSIVFVATRCASTDRTLSDLRE